MNLTTKNLRNDRCASRFAAFKTPHASCGGFTLVEVMIAVLILAIGLLGMAGLQTTGLQQSRSSYFRTQAAILASDMADSIRANRQGAVAGNYDNIDSSTAVAEPGCDPELASCNSGEIATFDIYRWAGSDHPGSVQNMLPEGRGLVTRNNNTFTVTVVWREPGIPATVVGTGCTGDKATDLPCFQLELLP